MKKALFIFSLLFGFSLTSKAQFKEIAASPEFKEPYSASTKLLLMKNGNLILADVGFRDSIRLRIYNKVHEEIAVTSYKMRSPVRRTYLGLNSIFEINGELVLFIIAEEEKAQVLYRVIADPNSGLVKKEKYLVEAKPEKKDELNAVWEDNFSTSKAENSDDYAIAWSTNYRSDKVKTIQVTLYNKEHAEVSRCYYETAAKEFEALGFKGLKVVNAETTALLFKGSAWKDGEDKMFLALAKKGSTALSLVEQKFPEEKLPRNFRLFYNNYSKKLVLAAVCVCGEKRDNKYLCIIDPASGKTEKTINYAFNEAFHEDFKFIYGKKYLPLGAPMNLLVDKSGNFSVIYQSDGFISTMSGSSTYSTALEITVADFDKNGKLQHNYLLPRKVVGGYGTYDGYAYIKNNDKAFLLFNDFRENIKRLQDGKEPKQVIVEKDCDAFYFPLSGNDVMPARKYLYKETDERDEHIQFTFGGAFAYDEENDVCITLRLNRDEKKRTKTVNVVWFKPQ